jgi:hypothetical protein
MPATLTERLAPPIIKHTREHYSPAQLARVLEKHPSAVTRWLVKGVLLRDGSRLFLDGGRTPGGWIVSAEAVDRFLAALTSDARGPAARPARIDSAEHAAADAACEAAGL